MLSVLHCFCTCAEVELEDFLQVCTAKENIRVVLRGMEFHSHRNSLKGERIAYFTVLGIPMQDFTVEATCQEVLPIMRKLSISDRFCMPDIGVSACTVLY